MWLKLKNTDYKQWTSFSMNILNYFVNVSFTVKYCVKQYLDCWLYQLKMSEDDTEINIKKYENVNIGHKISFFVKKIETDSPSFSPIT